MKINIKTFAGKTDKKILSDFILKITGSAFPSEWFNLSVKAYKQHVSDYMKTLNREHYDEAYHYIGYAETLAEDKGRTALLRAIEDDDHADNLRRILTSAPDPRAGVLLLITDHDGLLKRASSYYFADCLYYGRSWRAYDMPENQDEAPDITDEIKQAFEKDAETLYAQPGVPIRLCADWYERIEDERRGRSYQCMMYNEDPPRSEHKFTDSNTVIARAIYPVREIALIFDTENNRIEITGKGGKEIHEALANVFCKHLYPDAPPKLTKCTKRMLNMATFGSRPTLDIQPGDSIDSILTEEINIGYNVDARLMNTRIKALCKHGQTQDVYHLAEQQFGAQFLNNNATINAVTLKIFFKPEHADKKPKSCTVSFRYPNTSNVNSLSEKYKDIITPLLERWGIYAESENDSAHAVQPDKKRQPAVPPARHSNTSRNSRALA